jgi:hypothetical protein
VPFYLTDETKLITSLLDSMSLIEQTIAQCAAALIKRFTLSEVKDDVELFSFYSKPAAKVASLLNKGKSLGLKGMIARSLKNTKRSIIKRDLNDYQYSKLHYPFSNAIHSILNNINDELINILPTGDRTQINKSLQQLCKPHFINYPPEIDGNCNKDYLTEIWKNLPNKIAEHFHDEFKRQYTDDKNRKGYIELGTVTDQIILTNISHNAPKLVLTNPSTKDARFHYRSNALRFVGRVNEFEKLREFIKDDPDPSKRIKAWSLLGEGGQGKSRLARQLCDKVIKEGWYAGFIEKSQNGIPDSWRPQQPTLIIIDYLFRFSNYDVIADLATWYRIAKDDCRHPVRVLILERDNQFITPRSDSEQSWNEMLHSKEALQLGQFDDDELVELMCEVFKFHKKHKHIDRNKFKKLITQDKKLYQRTLFVIYHADLLANNDQREIENREELLNKLLKREYERWNNIKEENKNIEPKVLKKYKRLVFLATLMDGAPENILDDQDLRSELPSDKYNKKIYESIIDRQQGEYSIDPLEPNIVGEWFVLQYLTAKDLDRIDHRAIPILIAKAFQHKDSQIDTVLYRSIQDFPNKVADIDKIIKPIEESDLKSDQSIRIRLAWILFAYTTVSDRAAIVDKYKVISRLEILDLSNPDVLKAYAKALYNLIKVTNEEKKRDAITKLEELDRSNPDVLEAYAKALCNLTTVANEETKREAITKLEKLDRSNPDILWAYVTALKYLTVETSEETKHQAIVKLERLDLSNPDVLWAYAKALKNLTVKTNERTKREAIIKLEKLDLSNPDVLWAYAKALKNLTVKTNEKTKREAIIKLEKLDLSNRDVLWAYAKALQNLTVKTNERTRREAITKLEKLFHNNPDFLETCEKALDNLDNSLSNSSLPKLRTGNE